MKKTRKLIGIICLLAVLMMVFSACQPGQSVQSTGSTQGAKDTPTEAPKKVSLRFSWWGGDARHQATLEALQLYMDRNSHVTIEAEYGGYGDYYQKWLLSLPENQHLILCRLIRFGLQICTNRRNVC